MKYYIIAGEASGDLHGSNLMKELKVVDPDARFQFFGGDLMNAVGGKLIKHYKEMAFMGFLNVILNIKTIKRNLELCKTDLLKFQPDVLILIDYPGFNLRMAEFARQNNIKVFYYISPKLWAWKEYRVKKMKLFVDELFTIFPFETEFYKKHNYKVNYVGNPLLDSIGDFKKKALPKEQFLKNNNLDERPIVALLCGSRVQEIKNTLPIMLKAARGKSDFQFIVAGVKTANLNLYYKIIGETKVPVIFNQTYELLNNAHCALVTSGTATLETALFNVPQTVLYKVEGGWFMDVLMRRFVLKTKWVSLPNIILKMEAIIELLQVDMTLKKVKNELENLLNNQIYRDNIFENYAKLAKMMGNPGCSKRTAEKMVELLKEKYTKQN